MTHKREDVVLVYYPYSDLTTYKKRPALIAQADDIQTGLAQKLVAMITSSLTRIGEARVTVLKNSDLGSHGHLNRLSGCGRQSNDDRRADY